MFPKLIVVLSQNFGTDNMVSGGFRAKRNGTVAPPPTNEWMLIITK